MVIAFLTCLCVCLPRLSACHIAPNISLVLFCVDEMQEANLSITFIPPPVLQTLIAVYTPFITKLFVCVLRNLPPLRINTHQTALSSPDKFKFQRFS